MKQNTKETIGSRGTVAGFRPLIGEERWHRADFEAVIDGYRPLLLGELEECSDEYFEPSKCTWRKCESPLVKAAGTIYHRRTKRPIPPPQVETFEAHGHVWYRHVPGDTQPVESNVDVFVLFDEMDASNSFDYAGAWDWGFYDDFRGNIIGYRFPDFPAVHTTLQQQQSFADTQGKASVQNVEKTEQSFQHDTTKQRLLTMYHGWCDVAPDSVAECIADVAKVLYPTDADRCEAEFQKWFQRVDFGGMNELSAKIIWKDAWNAAKQQKP